MRVLVLHSSYGSGAVSGENRVVADEVRLVREAGHDVDVWTTSIREANGLRLLKAGVGAVWSREAVATVRARIRRQGTDVVHCHNLFPSLSPAVLRGGADGTLVVMTLHNYRLLCLPSSFLWHGTVCEACLGRIPWR